MNRRIVLLPALALAATSLSGCVAVAIPALAGSAMVGSRMDGKAPGDTEATAAASMSAPPTPAPAPVAAPPPVPSVTVMTATTVAPTPAPTPVIPSPVTAAPLAAAPMTTAPVAGAPPPPAPMAVKIPAPAPPPVPVKVIAAAPAPAAAAPAVAVAAATAPAVVPAVVPAAPAAYPASDRPLTDDQFGFARFVRYSQASAVGAKGGADLLSAMLSDPVALDGQRRRCAAGEQAVALIDLDPKGGIFSPPANPDKQPGLALGLAVMREAGVEIAWLSDLSVNESGTLRTVLERSGLDPRGEDIISLRRDGEDSKHKRKDNLAGITCIVAIAGDERADFDERYKYLRSPEAGAGLEPVIGNGWFLIEPLLGKKGK